MKIEIVAPKLGKANGTLGYVMNYLNNIELKILGVKGGGIGVFQRKKVLSSETQNDWSLVAIWNPAIQEMGQYYNHYHGDVYMVKAAENDSYEEPAMFRVLTPAAEKVATEFIKKCAEILLLRINEDEEDMKDVTIEINA